MKVTERTISDVIVIEFKGRLDTLSVPNAAEQIERIVGDDKMKILLNFENLEWISSAGIGLLITLYKKTKDRDGEIRFCNMNEVVRMIFETSGLKSFFKMFMTEQAALEQF